MSSPSKRDLTQIEAVLESMTEDLAELVSTYGLGACVVRVISEGNGLLLTAKAHGMHRGGYSSPEELVSVRKRVKP